MVVGPDDTAGLAALAEAELARGHAVGLLALEPPDGLPAAVTVLDPPRDPADYAHVLYGRLREADARGLDVVLVVAPPAHGIGAAVTDRLTRAAAGGRIP